MYESLLGEFCLLYGFDQQGGALEDVIVAMEMVAAKNKAYLIIKLDGERAAKKFTVAFSAADPGVGAIRMDADSLQECMDHLLKTVIALKGEGRIH
ncbi:hypothetical protein ACYT84_13355 [Ralstonia solanacearum]|uniref:hypothetical protein n=1 Tax=Ralstonia solanacearum TaxID=305 RepID=UPI0018D16AB7|nr:hypothetical protein [Ralstonia solanacearum]